MYHFFPKLSSLLSLLLLFITTILRFPRLITSSPLSQDTSWTSGSSSLFSPVSLDSSPPSSMTSSPLSLQQLQRFYVSSDNTDTTAANIPLQNCNTPCNTPSVANNNSPPATPRMLSKLLRNFHKTLSSVNSVSPITPTALRDTNSPMNIPYVQAKPALKRGIFFFHFFCHFFFSLFCHFFFFFCLHQMTTKTPKTPTYKSNCGILLFFLHSMQKKQKKKNVPKIGPSKSDIHVSFEAHIEAEQRAAESERQLTRTFSTSEIETYFMSLLHSYKPAYIFSLREQYAHITIDDIEQCYQSKYQWLIKVTLPKIKLQWIYKTKSVTHKTNDSSSQLLLLKQQIKKQIRKDIMAALNLFQKNAIN